MFKLKDPKIPVAKVLPWQLSHAERSSKKPMSELKSDYSYIRETN